MTFCEGPPRDGVVRLRCAYLELYSAISSRERVLQPGGQPLRNAVLDSTIGQMRVEAAFATIHAIEGHHPTLPGACYTPCTWREVIPKPMQKLHPLPCVLAQE